MSIKLSRTGSIGAAAGYSYTPPSIPLPSSTTNFWWAEDLAGEIADQDSFTTWSPHIGDIELEAQLFADWETPKFSSTAFNGKALLGSPITRTEGANKVQFTGLLSDTESTSGSLFALVQGVLASDLPNEYDSYDSYVQCAVGFTGPTTSELSLASEMRVTNPTRSSLIYELIASIPVGFGGSGVSNVDTSNIYYLYEFGVNGSASYARINNVPLTITNPLFPIYPNLNGYWTDDLSSGSSIIFTLSSPASYSYVDPVGIAFYGLTSSVPSDEERDDLISWIEDFYSISLG